MMFFWITYFIVLCLNIHKLIRHVFAPIFLILLFVFTLLNESCYTLFGVQINTDIASIIAGMNANEIVEFPHSYISLPFATLLIIFSISVITFYFFASYKPHYIKRENSFKRLLDLQKTSYSIFWTNTKEEADSIFKDNPHVHFVYIDKVN